MANLDSCYETWMPRQSNAVKTTSVVTRKHYGAQAEAAGWRMS